MSDISYRILIDERYEAELNRLRIERNAAWRENEELRELVAELASFISRADWLQWPELADRMAKLRVEVE